MGGLIADERDLKFVLFDLLRVQDLAEHPRYAHVDRETIGMLVDEAVKLSEQRLFPLNISGDKAGAQFDKGNVRAVPGMAEAYQEFVENGWLTMSESEELDGQALPEIVKFATHEQFLAACFPFMCFVNLTHDAAKLIELYGDEQQKDRYMSRMYGGEWTGTMCLSEPGVGSDVGALKTRASPAEDGSYRIKGKKIWITNGEHDIAGNIVHLVLARIDGDPQGTRGLSIFIVPKYRLDSDGSPGPRNDVNCMGIEHKMGLHASPTTALAFGDDDDCHGYLLGKPQEGIKIMFHMMNQSRLEVGLFGLGTCSTVYRHALEYAKERYQGTGLDGTKKQVTIINHPDVRRNLLTMKAYVEGMRVMLYYCAYAMDRAVISSESEDRKKWQGIVDLLIPLCKALPTEKATEFSSLSIQVYGGAGYTSEYPVEQYMRDSKVACIFEGTTGIQGIDFALRKIQMKEGSVFQGFLSAMDEVIDDARARSNWRSYAEQLCRTRDALASLPEVFAGCEADIQLYNRLQSATSLMEASAELFVAYFLLWSAMVAEDRISGSGDLPGDQDERSAAVESDPALAHLAGKLDAARYFIANQLPVVDGKIFAIANMDHSIRTIADASL